MAQTIPDKFIDEHRVPERLTDSFHGLKETIVSIFSGRLFGFIKKYTHTMSDILNDNREYVRLDDDTLNDKITYMGDNIFIGEQPIYQVVLDTINALVNMVTVEDGKLGIDNIAEAKTTLWAFQQQLKKTQYRERGLYVRELLNRYEKPQQEDSLIQEIDSLLQLLSESDNLQMGEIVAYMEDLEMLGKCITLAHEEQKLKQKTNQ